MERVILKLLTPPPSVAAETRRRSGGCVQCIMAMRFSTERVPGVARFAWATLCFNMAVVLWGAFASYWIGGGQWQQVPKLRRRFRDKNVTEPGTQKFLAGVA